MNAQLPPPVFTPWPVIWKRALRSSQAVARRNALEASRVLAERRRQREEVEQLLGAD
jgi:hypothetical protein